MEHDAPSNLAPPAPRLGAGNEPPLHRAARLGDHDAIRRLVAAGADVNEVCSFRPDGYERALRLTPLIAAIRSSDGATGATIRLLMELGADPTVRAGHSNAVDWLRDGIVVDSDRYGERLQALVDADIPATRKAWVMAQLVLAAATIGDAARLQALLDRGASPDPRWTPQRGRRRAAAFRAREARWRRAHRSPEDDEARLERMEQADREYEAIDLSAPRSDDIPIFQAVESGHPDCARVLLDAGANLFVRDNEKRTAMYYTATAESALLLKERGLPVEDLDELGWSPLVNAISESEARVRALLAAGADVNGTHDRGFTVFMSAVGSMERELPVMRLLVEAGANVHAVTELGWNAFHAAIDVNGEANEERSIRETLGFLKELGVNIEQRNLRDETPLAKAILWGTGTEVRVLCELGADPKAVVSWRSCGGAECAPNKSPLLVVATRNALIEGGEKVGALLKAGADPAMTDSEGHTPLAYAVGELCDDAEQREAAFRSFFLGLAHTPGSLPSAAADREAAVASARPDLRKYIEAFAAPIPIDRTWSCKESLRAELLTVIELLAAYSGWRPRKVETDGA